MATGQITWEQFITVNNDARGVRYKRMYRYYTRNK